MTFGELCNDRVIFLSIFNLVRHNYVMTVKQYYVLGEDVGRSNQTGEIKRVYCKVQNLLPHIMVYSFGRLFLNNG